MVRYIGCLRKLDPKGSTITLILTDIVRPNGIDQVVTSVRYRTISLTSALVTESGGWESIRRLQPSQRVSLDTYTAPGSTKPVANHGALVDKD